MRQRLRTRRSGVRVPPGAPYFQSLTGCTIIHDMLVWGVLWGLAEIPTANRRFSAFMYSSQGLKGAYGHLITKGEAVPLFCGYGVDSSCEAPAQDDPQRCPTRPIS